MCIVNVSVCSLLILYFLFHRFSEMAVNLVFLFLKRCWYGRFKQQVQFLLSQRFSWNWKLTVVTLTKYKDYGYPSWNWLTGNVFSRSFKDNILFKNDVTLCTKSEYIRYGQPATSENLLLFLKLKQINHLAGGGYDFKRADFNAPITLILVNSSVLDHVTFRKCRLSFFPP